MSATDKTAVNALLLDIFLIFKGRNTNRLFSRDLVAALNGCADPLWSELRNRKSVDELWLARQLRQYGIHPSSLRIGDHKGKGYFSEDFQEAIKLHGAAIESTSKSARTENYAAPSPALLAHVVAMRCQALSAPDRELIWFLQWISHRQGLERLSAELLKEYASELGTPTMQRVGAEPGRTYREVEVNAICREIEAAGGGGCKILEERGRRAQAARFRKQAEIARQIMRLSGEHVGPDYSQAERNEAPSCTLEEILDLPRLATVELPALLREMCTDLGRPIESFKPWYFPSLVPCLRDYMQQEADCQRGGVAETGLVREVRDALDYLLEVGGMVVLDGPPLRIGKSFAARTWCEARPGLARYVQVPAITDDTGFFRAIAKAIGSDSGLSLNGTQLREGVERVLQSSKLLLVLDNAHYLWPQSNRREALPSRLNWLVAALANHIVPVALLSTPQFASDQKSVQENTGWTGAQFLNQVGEYKKLPNTLSMEELIAVAKHCLPDADDNSAETLADYAKASRRYLSAIESAIKRARVLAAKDGRDNVCFEDVKKAITEYVMPSDRAMTQAVAPQPDGKPAAVNVPAPSIVNVGNDRTGNGRIRTEEQEPAVTSRRIEL